MAPWLAGHSRVRRWVNAAAALVLGGGIALIPVVAQAAPVVLYDMDDDGAWTTLSNNTWVAESFTSGSGASTLSSVAVHVRNNSGSSTTVTVDLYSSSSGAPGTKLVQIASQTVGGWFDNKVSGSPGTALTASTQYFIVVSGVAGSSAGWKYAATTPTTAVTPTPTFTALQTTNGGSSWGAAPGAYYRMKVEATAVTAPAAPTLNSLTPGSTTLGVNATLGSDGGSAVTDVEYSTDGGTNWNSSGQTTGSFTITGLTNGQSYSVLVRAVNTVGNGAQSNALSGTPLGPPGAPTGVSATAGDGAAAVSWSAPAATGGSPILSYTATSTPGSLTCTTATTSCTVTGLSNGTPYTFRVTATNAQGSGTASVASSAVTPEAPPPPPPSPSPTPSPSATDSPSASPTQSASASSAPSPSASSPRPSRTPAESTSPPAEAPTESASPTPAESPSATPSASPSATPSASPSASSTTSPSPSASPAPSEAPSSTPSAAPEPSPSSALPPPGQSILTDDAQFGPVLTLEVNLEIGAPAAGRSATISANGLAPDSAVEIRIYSEPRVIGSGTADATGSATVATEIPTDLEPGTHTIMALGTAPNGQPVQSIGAFSLSGDSLVTAVAPPGQVATPMEPGDPQLERALAAGKPVYDVALFPSVTATVALAGAAVVGLAGIGGLVGDPSGQRSSERGKLAGVVTKKLKALKPVEPGPGDLSRSWAMPGTATTDRWISVVPQKAGRFTALLPRLMVDGSWARAMLGSLAFALWVLGGVLGFISSASVGFQSLSPSLPLMVAIIVLGVLDAAAGAIAWGVMFLCALVTGHVTNFYDLRTMLGLFVIFASIPLLAHAIRPLRRKVATTRMERFDQIADYVMPPVFLAFAAASMFKALNGLSGLELVDKADVIWIQLLVAGAYLLRRGLEDVATYAYPQRSAEVQPQKLSSPGTGLTWVSVVMRVLIFIIVAAPFFGLGWITMLAALLTAVPMVLKIYEDKLPNSVPLNKWYPRGVFRFAILLVLGIYVSAWMLGQDASDDTVRQTYNIILLPGIIAALFELFGREGWEWPDTWSKRLVGFGIWAFAVLVVTGLISLT